jgi:hypothetical protein
VYIYYDDTGSDAWGARPSLAPSDRTSGAGLGRSPGSVRLSGNGNKIVIGAYLDSTSIGAIWIYETTDHWNTRIARTSTKMTASNIPGVELGKGVAITYDGTLIFAGAPGYTSGSGNNGMIYIYTATPFLGVGGTI